MQTTLANANNLKNDTCHRKDNMKKTLIKVKASQNDNHEYGIDTCERKIV